MHSDTTAGKIEAPYDSSSDSDEGVIDYQRASIALGYNPRFTEKLSIIDIDQAGDPRSSQTIQDERPLL